MLTTPHAVVGAAIAAALPYPQMAIPLAIGSHFLLDIIPHWQEVIGGSYKPVKLTYVRLPIDILLAVFLVGIIASWHPERSMIIWLSAITANLPDLDVVIVNIFPRLLKSRSLFKKYYDWHRVIQKETKSMVGVVTQGVVVMIGMLRSVIQ